MHMYFVRFGALFEVVQYPVHDLWLLDTGNDRDAAAALLAGFDVDLACRDVGKGSELGAEGLNTCLRRWVQVMAARRWAGCWCRRGSVCLVGLT